MAATLAVMRLLDDDIERILATDRVLLVSQLIARGWPEDGIRDRLRSLRRVRRGAYVDDWPDNPLDRYRLVCIAAGRQHEPSWCVSHASAAALCDLPLIGPPPSQVHLSSVARTRAGASRGDVRLHGRAVPAARLIPNGPVLVTDVARTLVDCARTMAPRDAVALADAAVHRGLVTMEQLATELHAARCCQGIARARTTLRRLDAGAESAGESWCRLVLVDVGFAIESQFVVTAADGFTARSDFRIRGTGVLVEFDGRAKYGLRGAPDDAWWREKRRHDRLTALGYEVVRLTWDDVRRPQHVRALVQAAVDRWRTRHGR